MRKFKIHSKRLISSILVVLMLTALIPAGTVFVNAATSFYYKYNPDYKNPQYASTFMEAWNEAQTTDNGCVGILTDVSLSSTLELPAGKSITIELNGHKLNRNRITQSSSANCNVITVGEGSTLTIYGGTKVAPKPTCTLSFNYYTGSSNSSASVKNKGLITGGCNTKNGGGISIEKNGSCNLYYTAVSGNRADDGVTTIGGYGGGIALRGDYAKLNMYNSEVSYNYAEVGGGICAKDADYARITMEQTDESVTSIITRNSVSKDGGGLAVVDSDQCKIKGDSSSEDGTKKSEIKVNFADDEGGGVLLDESEAVIDGIDIGYNQAFTDGGGIYLNEDTCAVKNCNIHNNSATGKGGGFQALFLYLDKI